MGCFSYGMKIIPLDGLVIIEEISDKWIASIIGNEKRIKEELDATYYLTDEE